MLEITRLRFGRNAFTGFGAAGKTARFIGFGGVLVVVGGRKNNASETNHNKKARTASELSISSGFRLFGASVSGQFAVGGKSRETRFYTNFVLYLELNIKQRKICRANRNIESQKVQPESKPLFDFAELIKGEI